MLLAGLTSCAATEQRALYAESRALGRDVKRKDAAGVQARVLPGARSSIDLDALLDQERSRVWSAALERPTSVRPEGLLFLSPTDPVEIVWTDQGWRFAVDPTDYYGQQTPRAALRSLVRASRRGRWDRLLALAPRRYRVGLSPEQLRRAWTEGEQAAELRRARDRLAAHLGDPIRADSHEAVLELGEGRAVRLEREGDRWVVVEF